MGIRVTGTPGAARPPNGLVPVTSVDSAVLKDIVRRMDVDSLNFYAEVLGKLLARLTTGAPATIAHGAAAISAYEHDQGVDNMEHHDSSGLSYANRVRTNSIVRLLWAADGKPWGPVLRLALPARRPGHARGPAPRRAGACEDGHAGPGVGPVRLGVARGPRRLGRVLDRVARSHEGGGRAYRGRDRTHRQRERGLGSPEPCRGSTGPLRMRRGWVVVVAALLGACSSPAATTVGPPAPVTSPTAVVSLLSPPPTAALPRPDRVRQEPWMRSLDRLIGDRPVSVSVEARGVRIYGHLPKVPRTPASNEKLLLSMAMLDRFGPDYRISTDAGGSAAPA